MSTRLIRSSDPLVDALPRYPGENMEFASDGDAGSVSSYKSQRTAQLYDELSDDDFFSDCSSQLNDEVSRLEREYFDALHVDNVDNNATFSTSDGMVSQERFLTSLEKENFHARNVTPDRPCSAFFKTDSFMPASEIFEMLGKDGFRPEHVRCLQRKPTGEVFLTFRNKALKDTFLEKSAFITPRQRHRLIPNNAERSLSFLTVYDAPYELSDVAIIHRLSPYCEVVWHRRGTYRDSVCGGVFNGLRHYRIRIKNAIPSYLRFGKFLIRLYHDGQSPTCRRCNRQGHKAAECRSTVCFNCEGLGHVARDCIKPMYCCVCKSGQHLARACPMSWHRDPPTTGATRGDARPVDGNNADVNMADDPAGTSSQPEGSPQPNAVPREDADDDDNAAGGSSDQPIDERPFRPIVVDPESDLAGEPEVPGDETPVSSGSAPVVGPDGLLIANEVDPVLQQRPDVPLNSSADLISFESSALPVSPPPIEPVITPECVSDEPVIISECVSDVPNAATPPMTWADVVDSVSPPLPPGEEISLSSRAPQPRVSRGRIQHRKPAPVIPTYVPSRKSTRPSRVAAPVLQKPSDGKELSTACNTPLPDSEEGECLEEREISKRKDPPPDNPS